MMNIRHTICLAAVLPLFALVACSRGEGLPTPGFSTVALRLTAERPEGPLSDGDSDPESMIHTVAAYRFEGGVLQEVIPGVAAGSEGLYTFSSAAPRGELRLVANADAVEALATLVPGAATAADFDRMEASLEEMTGKGLTMNGTLQLDETPVSAGARAVTLRRSVARIDLRSRDAGVEVHAVEIRRIAGRGYVWEPSTPATPASASRADFRRNYGDSPLITGREVLLYLCEQTGDALEVEVTARFDGGWHRLRSTLPATIRRNTVYTLEVYGHGADAGVEVSSGSWETGSGAASTPILEGLVDVGASDLPAGVRVNAACDTLYIPHTPSELRVVLRAGAGSTVTVDGEVRGVSVEPIALTRGLEQVASVTVRSPLRMPGTKTGYVGLTLWQEEVSSGRVVLCFEANPVRVEGLLTFDDEGICDFDRYIEGELARINLPAGMNLHLEFDDGESRWMNLVEADGAWRLLAGWKPNDPTADGRQQQGYLVVTDAAGGDPERYAVRRRNWGLPVVEIGGRWWCKYNLRGNVKRFEEQVPVAGDPAADAALADHLIACDGEELLALLGDQYQAGNPDGLPLRHDGTAFYHEGMASTGQNFGTLDPAEMAPYGYRIPDYDDYAFFTRNENYNIGGVGERTYRNAADEEITVRIQEREAEFLGHAYGTIAVYEFRAGGATWVLAGLGHQWSTVPGNISPMMLLLATYGNSSKTWIMEGYAAADRPGQNWIKYVANNTTKTRMVRCVKTPVEYMYD